MVLLAGCEGCKIEEPRPLTELDKLPPPTQEGKNTFGCLVNDTAWVTKTSIDAVAVYQQGILQIFGNRYNPFETVSLVLNDDSSIIQADTYSLTQIPIYTADAFFEREIDCDYEPENTLSGSVTITKLDRLNYIVSGLFEFKTVTQSCDTLKVTNGRFDIRYIP